MNWVAGEAEMVKVPAGALTTWLTEPELARKLLVATKAALMVCVPTLRELVVKAATPEELRVPVPICVVPSRKLTVPETTPAGEVTVAVKVMLVPAVAGEPEVVTTVMVAAALMASVPGWMVAM